MTAQSGRRSKQETQASQEASEWLEEAAATEMTTDGCNKHQVA